MTITVLGISGSPRRHGNTETLLDSFLAGAKDAGAEIEKVVLKDMDFSACQGCNACHKSGNCIVKDDAPVIYEKILAADCIAVASPIYSMGITAQLKGFIDRGQYLWARKLMLKTLTFTDDHIRRHKAVFVSTAGQNNPDVFNAAFPAMKALFNGCGFEYYANVTANNMDESGGIRKHPTALSDACAKGQDVVRAIAAEKGEN